MKESCDSCIHNNICIIKRKLEKEIFQPIELKQCIDDAELCLLFMTQTTENLASKCKHYDFIRLK